MIPVVENTIQKVGNIPGDKIQMTLDENSIEHLQSLLSDIYSDVELAIVREYSTNAFDSHVEAGTTRPIEITTPSWMDHNFVVKDYGIGMSVDDIYNVYSKYGASTKRETNEQTGMLGIGAKSALAYGDSFTVEAVKNGVKVIALVGKTESGIGEITIVDSYACAEPNGVTITIPVKDYYSFNLKVESFFSFWKPGTVLVNEERPVSVWDSAEEISPGMWLFDSNSHKDYVLMGNVAYPVQEKNPNRYGSTIGIFEHNFYGAEQSILVQANIGDLTFAPSREELSYTEKTKQFLAAKRTDFESVIIDHIESKVGQCETYVDACIYVHGWAKNVTVGNKVKSHDFLFDGVKVGGEALAINYKRWQGEGNSVRSERRIAFSSLRSVSVIVTGFNLKASVSAGHKDIIKDFAATNSQDISYSRPVIFTELNNEPWMKNILTISWKDVKTKAKAALGSVKSTALPPSAVKQFKDNYALSDNFVINPDDKVIYCAASEAKDVVERNKILELGRLFFEPKGNGEVKLFIVYMNKFPAFKKENPQAIHYSQLIAKAEKKAGFTQNDIALEATRSFGYKNLAKKLAGKLTDDRLNSLLEEINAVDIAHFAYQNKLSKAIRIAFALFGFTYIRSEKINQIKANFVTDKNNKLKEYALLMDEYPKILCESYSLNERDAEDIAKLINLWYDNVIQNSEKEDQ